MIRKLIRHVRAHTLTHLCKGIHKCIDFCFIWAHLVCVHNFEVYFKCMLIVLKIIFKSLASFNNLCASSLSLFLKFYCFLQSRASFISSTWAVHAEWRQKFTCRLWWWCSHNKVIPLLMLCLYNLYRRSIHSFLMHGALLVNSCACSTNKQNKRSSSFLLLFQISLLICGYVPLENEKILSQSKL